MECKKELRDRPRINTRFRLKNYHGLKENAPVIQFVPVENEDLDGDYMYCVQYAGNGKYFTDAAELLQYVNKRWGLLDTDALTSANFEEVNP